MNETLVLYLLIYVLRTEMWHDKFGPVEIQYEEVYRQKPIYAVKPNADGSKTMPCCTAVITELADNERLRYKEHMKLSELVRWRVYEIHLRDGTVHPVSVGVTHE